MNNIFDNAPDFIKNTFNEIVLLIKLIDDIDDKANELLKQQNNYSSNTNEWQILDINRFKMYDTRHNLVIKQYKLSDSLEEHGYRYYFGKLEKLN